MIGLDPIPLTLNNWTLAGDLRIDTGSLSTTFRCPKNRSAVQTGQLQDQDGSGSCSIEVDALLLHH